jgi:replicative DNA helicase
VKTFIPQLDKFYHTMLPGQLHVLAGRPGSGKTAFAVDLAVKTARECKEYNDRQENDKKKKCVLIFSCEMTSEEIVSRMISNLSSVTYSQYEEDFKAIAARPEQFKLVNQSQKILSDYPIHIADQTFNIEDIVSGVREIAFTYDVELVVIDYIQKIRSNVLGGKTSLHEIINKTVTELKNIAKNKGTVVFALAQAQREIDSLTRGPGGANKPRASSEPDLGNIRDSSSIESEADTVSFIYQDTNGEEPNLGDSKEPVAIMKYNMKKNRNGTFGVARIEFDKKFSRFTAGDNNHNYAKD